ncbi:response regulator transcription factor [Thalassotalea sp. ND16A]|uniref:response regulator transcription factor n=1 Tax=Thalassotalea sp. ND16A TaxID=1535422 RepID=UPI00051A5797|nr:response regulator transcription factor [Thalassotalea sp. ND16A]KGJ90525.1 response regulator receiver protein [Thalassotalea sp. ND16A]
MSSPIAHILLIEDDLRLAGFIANFLVNNGYQVTHCACASELDLKVQSSQVDLILCDIMLPGTSGFQLLKEARKDYFGPFIFMSALSDVENQLHGFKLGADDYITKPVKPELLLARIKAVLYRQQGRDNKPEDKSLSIGNLTVNQESRTVVINSERLKLSRHEFDVLWLLALNKNKALTREYLFLNITGKEYDGLDRTMDGRVSRLRKKVNAYENAGCKIRTMWGKGYMLSTGAEF